MASSSSVSSCSAACSCSARSGSPRQLQHHSDNRWAWARRRGVEPIAAASSSVAMPQALLPVAEEAAHGGPGEEQVTGRRRIRGGSFSARAVTSSEERYRPSFSSTRARSTAIAGPLVAGRQAGRPRRGRSSETSRCPARSAAVARRRCVAQRSAGAAPVVVSAATTSRQQLLGDLHRAALAAAASAARRFHLTISVGRARRRWRGTRASTTGSASGTESPHSSITAQARRCSVPPAPDRQALVRGGPHHVVAEADVVAVDGDEVAELARPRRRARQLGATDHPGAEQSGERRAEHRGVADQFTAGDRQAVDAGGDQALDGLRKRVAGADAVAGGRRAAPARCRYSGLPPAAVAEPSERGVAGQLGPAARRSTSCVGARGGDRPELDDRGVGCAAGRPAGGRSAATPPSPSIRPSVVDQRLATARRASGRPRPR